MARKNNDECNNLLPPFATPVPMDFDMLFRHYFNFILRNVFQIFKFGGIPDTVDETFMKYCLFLNGKVTFFKLTSGDLVALNGVYSGDPNLYYVPDKMLVNNPRLLKSYRMQRDVECVVVYCSESDIYNVTGKCGGLYTLISRTATMLADGDLSINVSQKNKRLINVLSAEDQNTKESIDIVIRKQYNGEPYAVVHKSLIDNVESVPITDKTGGTNDIIQLIECQQYILSHFYEALGLQTHDNMKKERLITAEVNDNENLAKLNINDMLCTIQSGLDKVNAMFGTDITVHLNPLLEPDQKSEAEPDQKSEAEPDQESEAEPDQESEAEPDQESEAEPDQKSEAEPDQESEAEPDQESEAEPESEINVVINQQDESSAEINIDTGSDSDGRVQDMD